EEARDHDGSTRAVLGRERAHRFVAVPIARNPAGTEVRSEAEAAGREQGWNHTSAANHARQPVTAASVDTAQTGSYSWYQVRPLLDGRWTTTAGVDRCHDS